MTPRKSTHATKKNHEKLAFVMACIVRRYRHEIAVDILQNATSGKKDGINVACEQQVHGPFEPLHT